MNTKLVQTAKQIDAFLMTHLNGGRGVHKTRRALRKELLCLLARFDEPKRLPKAPFKRPKWTTLRGRMDDGELRRLAQCAYLVSHEGMADAKAIELTRAKKMDLRYLRKLCEALEVPLDEVCADPNDQVDALVEALLEDLVVRLEPRALEDMLLAALEAYAVKKPGRGNKYTEAYGVCFGTAKHTTLPGRRVGTETILNITRVTTQLRAPAAAGWVEPNADSERVHRQVAEHFFRHLDLLGDYHTHPYATLAQMRAYPDPWGYSDADQAAARDWLGELLGEGRRAPRFSLILAIARGGRSGRRVVRKAKNRVHINVDRYFVQMAAFRIQTDGTYDDDLRLLCPGLEV